MTSVIKPKSNKEDKIVRALTVEEHQYFTPYVSSHSLRHTFGTRCIESGVAPVTISSVFHYVC